MSNSPAEVLRQRLLDQGVGVDPDVDSSSDFPIYVGQMPDFVGAKDLAIAVYDTAGRNDGRIQRTGETLIHPGLQVRVRHNTYQDGYAKADEISQELDNTPAGTVVTVGGTDYVIDSLNRSSIIPLGPEPDKRSRHSFTVNLLATITRC